MDPHRSQRVSEAIREELSELIGYEMNDPRIAMVDVTEVLIGPDMRHARVRLHLGGDENTRTQTMRALEGARHYLRRQLGHRLKLYRIPEMHLRRTLTWSPRRAWRICLSVHVKAARNLTWRMKKLL